MLGIRLMNSCAQVKNPYSLKLFPILEIINKNLVVFGSWSYTTNYLNYTLLHGEPTSKNFTDNQEWKLITYKVKKKVTHY